MSIYFDFYKQYDIPDIPVYIQFSTVLVYLEIIDGVDYIFELSICFIKLLFFYQSIRNKFKKIKNFFFFFWFQNMNTEINV